MSRKGFTLIELLVVVAIVGALAALLFPVFAKVRENGRRTTCLSNEQQLGQAFLLYAQNNDECLPAWCLFTGPTTPVLNENGVSLSWDIALQPYLKSGQVLICPSDIHSVRRDVPGVGQQMFRSYSITLNTEGKPLSKIPAAANTVLLLETFSMFGLTPEDWAGEAALGVLDKESLTPPEGTGAEKPEFRHNDTGCYLFADMHTKAVRGPKPPFPGYRTDSDGIALCGPADPLPR